MKNIFKLFFVLAAFLIFAKSVQAMTVAPAVIEADTVWTAEAGPYLMVSTVSVVPGAKLTIESGVVVKSTRYGVLEVAGSLEVSGNSNAPVIFTSYHDDSAGGDTNNNGSDTVPAGGDWQWIKFLPGSSGNVVYTEVRYGGYKWSTGEADGEILVESAVPVLRNLKVHLGHPLGRGVRLTNSAAVIEDSEIFGFYYGSVRVEGGAPTLRRNNFHSNNWVAIEITSDTFTGQPIISKNQIHDNTNYGLINASAEVVDARENFWGTPSGPSNAGGAGDTILGNVLYDPWIGKTPDPVLVIPGIMGSWQKRGEWRIDPILHTYDNLLGALRQAGYQDNQTLFTFPYDWKISNVLTAHYLGERLAAIRAVCGCSKVDVIAHSMGGLIARQYISSNEYAEDIDQVVFLGVPHRGAPKDYLAWEAGEIGPFVRELFMEKLLYLQAIHAGFNNLFDYIHNYPIATVQELLPTYNYLHNANDNQTREYPNNYPTNQFLENLNSQSVLQNLASSHVRFINIIGDTLTNDTVNMIRVVDPLAEQLPKWEHGYPENYGVATGDHGLEFGSGDKTVPLASATYFNVVGTEEVVLNSDHGSLPTAAQEEIIEKFTSNAPQVSVHNWQLPNIFLLIRVFSPVDVQITDPQGRRIGRVIASEAWQSLEYDEIPNAFYSGFDTDNEFIVIPNPVDGEYQIQTQGTADGEFRVVSTVMPGSCSSLSEVERSEGEVGGSSCQQETEIIATTTVDQVDSFNLLLTVSAETPTIEVVPPEPPPMVEPDLVPPIITINAPEERNYTRLESLTLDVSAIDYRSGIGSLEIKLDGIIKNSGDIIDLFYLSLGNHELTVTATDLAGNTRSKSINFTLVATRDSTISDVQRCYSLGWISRKNVKKKLIKMLEQEKPPRQILKVVDRWRTHINDQAYNLLKADLNWLMNAVS